MFAQHKDDRKRIQRALDLAGLPSGMVSSFIHSGYFYSASSSPLLLRGVPEYSPDTVSEFHAEAPQATASEGLAQGPCVAALAVFEPATIRTKGDESTNDPPRPNSISSQFNFKLIFASMPAIFFSLFNSTQDYETHLS